MTETLPILMTAIKFSIPAVYFLVSLGYIFEFSRKKGEHYSWTRPLYLLGIVLHTLLIAYLFLEQGYFPFTTAFKGLFFCSWILSLLYFCLEYIIKENRYGAFLCPVNFIIAVVALLLLRHGTPLPVHLRSYYFVVHVSLSFMAYACFFFSFNISVMYLLQHHQIKNRHLGAIFQRLPSLDSMDTTVTRTDALGLGFFCIGLVSGYLWMDSIAVSGNTMNIKIGFSILVFIAYLAEHLLRIGKGWKGKRACVISIAGFILVLCTLLIGRHGY